MFWTVPLHAPPSLVLSPPTVQAMNADIQELRDRLEREAGGSVSGVLTCEALAAAYLAAARTRFSPRKSEPNNELLNCAAAFKPLLMLYADMPAEQLTPVRLRAVQLLLIQNGTNSCRTINAKIARVRRLWKWAAARMLVPPSCLEGLRAVEPVRPPQAPTHPPVQPIPVETVEAVIPFMADRQRGTNVPGIIVSLLLLTGMRPGEACRMKGEEIDRSYNLWLYRPAEWKGTWQERERVVPLGPRTQLLLTPLLRPGPLFCTKRGRQFSVDSLGQSLRRACGRAGVPNFSANRIRHTAATMADSRCDLQTASDLLGHMELRTTARYVGRRVAARAERYALAWA